jgi:DNA-binding response OmpR family regulator
MKPTVVIIDDQAAMRGILEHFLAGEYRTAGFDDAPTAIRWCESNPLPDCIIVDLNLPGMNGFEFIEIMRANPKTATVPIIVLSSSEGSEVKIRCLRLGADDYMIKPFNPEELLARMESIARRIGNRAPSLTMP